MADTDIDHLSERELDALTWQHFFMRPGDRPIDPEGYWSARMGVRMTYPHYANDAVAVSRIEAHLIRRGLTQAYTAILSRLTDNASGDSPAPNTQASLDTRRRAALITALANSDKGD